MAPQHFPIHSNKLIVISRLQWNYLVFC